jgi:hypothetical protein
MKASKAKQASNSLTDRATRYYKSEPLPQTVSCTVRIRKELHENLNRTIGKLRASGSKVTFQSVLASAAQAFVEENN